jgi:hypothetical protein
MFRLVESRSAAVPMQIGGKGRLMHAAGRLPRT